MLGLLLRTSYRGRSSRSEYGEHCDVGVGLVNTPLVEIVLVPSTTANGVWCGYSLVGGDW